MSSTQEFKRQIVRKTNEEIRKVKRQRNALVVVLIIFLLLFAFLYSIQVITISYFTEEEDITKKYYQDGSDYVEPTITSNSTQYSNYSINFIKHNISEYVFESRCDKLINFTITIRFTTNITLDALNRTGTGFGIWNYSSSTWDYSQNITITTNLTQNLFFNQSCYLDSLGNNCSFKFIIKTSNKFEDYDFRLMSNASGWFNYSQVQATLYKNETNEGLIEHYDTIYAHWKFDEGTGNKAYDSSGNGHNASLISWSSGNWASGHIGPYCIYPHDVGEWADCDKFVNFTGGFSIEFWTREPNAYPKVIEPLASKWNPSTNVGWVIFFYFGYPIFTIQEHPGKLNQVIGTGNPALNVYDGQWHHFVCTYNNDTTASGMKIYADGQEISVVQTNNGVDTFDNNWHMYIGYRMGWSAYYNGTMDNFIVHKVVLNQSEVLAGYNGRNGRELLYNYSLEYYKNNDSYHEFNENWNDLEELIIDIDVRTNRTIDSNMYLNQSIQIYNFTGSCWENLTTDSILGNYSNIFSVNSTDFLNQTLATKTNVIIRVNTSNLYHDYEIVQLRVNMTGWFLPRVFEMNATLYNSSHYDNDFRNYNFTKIIDYTLRFSRKWNKINWIMSSITISSNHSLSSDPFLGNCILIYDYYEEEWVNDWNKDLIGDDISYYFEIVPTYKYVEHINDDYCYLKIRMQSVNVNNNYTFNVNWNVKGWYVLY